MVKVMKLIHIHISKTAGTHLNKMFLSNANYRYYDYCGFKQRYNLLTSSESDLLIDATAETAFITSHYFKLEFLQEKADRHYISVIRDPVSRIVSEYIYKKFRNRFEKGYNSAASTKNFETWLSDEAKLFSDSYGVTSYNWHKNWQSHVLEGYRKRSDITILRTERLFDDFKYSRLVSLNFVKNGFFDQLRFKYLRTNTSDGRDKSLDEERKHVLQKYSEFLREQNFLDYQLYESINSAVLNGKDQVL
jgi:hypothetical protein